MLCRVCDDLVKGFLALLSDLTCITHGCTVTACRADILCQHLPDEPWKLSCSAERLSLLCEETDQMGLILAVGATFEEMLNRLKCCRKVSDGSLQIVSPTLLCGRVPRCVSRTTEMNFDVKVIPDFVAQVELKKVKQRSQHLCELYMFMLQTYYFLNIFSLFWSSHTKCLVSGVAKSKFGCLLLVAFTLCLNYPH